MKGVDQRRKEKEALKRYLREQRKRRNAPIIEEIDIDGIEVRVPVTREFASLLEQANNKLADIALKYEIPLTEEQAFLVAVDDTFLPQYEKVELDQDEQVQLMANDWAILQSSNLAAVKIDGLDLLIRFHSGDTYRYPEQAEMYFPFNEALSPGRLLWRTIRFIRGYRKE
jgi:hypothetical protein